MGNSATDKTAKAYTFKEMRGKNVTKAKAGVCKYEKNVGVDPQGTKASTYTRKSRPNRKKNPAIAGSVPKSVVNKCRNSDPSTAKISTKKVGGQ